MRLQQRWYLGLLPIVAACGITEVETSSLLDEEVGEPFVETLDAAALESIVEAADADFEVLFDEDLTAREIAIFAETSHTERLQGRVVAIDGGERFVLLAGNLAVSSNVGTRFWVGDEQVSSDAFSAVVRQELAAGRQAPLFAERPVSEAAQAPVDESFVASDITLGGDGTPVMRVRVGRGNLERVVSPAAVSSPSGVASMSGSLPDAWLRVLGRAIRIHLRDGITNAVRHHHQYGRVVDIREDVSAIDVDRRKLTLADGTVVRVTGRTNFLHRHEHARSLRAAAEAMRSGNRVRAHVLGTVERDRGVLALWIALKVIPVEQAPVVREFDGVVAAAEAVEGGTVLTLANGTSVCIVESTEVVAADASSPSTVEELMQALEDDREVVVRGTAHVLTEQPLALEGVRVVLQAEAPPTGEVPTVVGTADAVTVDGSVVLLDGTTVVVTDATTVEGADANSPSTVAALLGMLDQDQRVEVRAFGTVDSPTQVTATRLVLRVLVRTFDVDVVSIDFGFGRLFFEDGSVGQLTPSSVITAIGDGPTDLIGVDAALAEGARVRARGTGFMMGRAPIPGVPETVQVITVELDRIP